MRRSVAFLVFSMLALGCKGPQGDTGPQGPPGPPGSQGPQGPAGQDANLADPPHVTSVSPDWGSGLTQVTLQGEHFGTAPTVWVDGVQADVVSATDTQIVVEPALAVDDPTQVVLTVEVDKQMSNGVGFSLVPSGTPGDLGFRMPAAPTGVAWTGGHLYVASGAWGNPNGGLYEVDSDGTARQVWAAPRVENPLVSVGPFSGFQAFDAPMHLVAHDTGLYMASAFGTLFGYDTATGAVTVTLPAPLVGNPQPGDLTGVAFDSDGDVYELDRGTSTLSDFGTDGTITPLDYDAGWVALASDGTSLYLLNDATKSIDVIEDPGGTPSYTTGWSPVPSTNGLRSITVLGSEVVVSDDQGFLYGWPVHTTGNDDGDTMDSWGSTDGYVYAVDALAAGAGNTVYLAQADSGAVRSLDTTDTGFATMVTAGSRVEFGIARDGDTWYLSSVGLDLFGSGPGYAGTTILDGAVVELASDGSSRLVEEQDFPTGLAVNPDHTLIVGDCTAGTLTQLDPSDGSTIPMKSGLGCVGGVYLAANGNVFYTNAWIPDGAEPPSALPGYIGRLLPDGTIDPEYVTGLPPITIDLVGVGDTLLSAPLAVGDSGFGTSSVYAADATTGGAATLLTPYAGSLSGMGATALGEVYGLRIPLGDIVSIDPDTGDLTPFGQAWLGWTTSVFGDGGPGLSAAFAMGSKADGTLVVADVAQGGLVGIAP